MEDRNNGKDHKWKSFFKPFARKSKENEMGLNKSKSDDISELIAKENEEKSENSGDGELELLRNKLNLQTKVSASLKIKYEAVMEKYKDMEQIKNKNELELNKIKKVMMENKKELDLSRGVMHELKKLSIHNLHELESNLLSSLQNVQKAIASQYENKYDCRVCMTNEKDTVLIPCGHFLCSQCVSKVPECPMCRAQIDKTVKLYHLHAI